MIHNRKFDLAFLVLIAIAISTCMATEDCCEPDETKPDWDDCTMYYVCCTGQFKHKSCPPGQYWNVDKCVTDNGECQATTPPPTTAPPTCVEGCKITDPSNCANFLECINGKYVSVSCPKGQYWNVDKCVTDNGECQATTPPPTTAPPTCVEGCKITDPSNCANFLECINGKYVSVSCPKGQYWNVDKCVTDNGECQATTPPPTTAPPTCVEGCKITDPSNCANFLECINGKYVSVSCPKGQYWNVDKCVTDNGECQATTPPPTTAPPTCVEGCKITDPSNCANFLECINGKYVSVSCPKGQYWNVDKCVTDNGECQATTPPPTTAPPTCVEGCKITDPSNCANFLECINGKYVSVSCPKGQYWNVDKCVTDNGECQATTPPPTTAPPTCVEGCKITDPSNCANFLECINGKYVSVSCPSGEYWNVNKCVTDNGECQGNPTTTPAQPTCVEGSKTTDTSNCANFLECINGKYVSVSCPSGEYWNVNKCVTDNGECQGNPSTTPAQPTCVEGSKTTDTSNCANFLECINGKYVSVSCPSGEYWNVNKCVTDNGECQGNPTTTPAQPTCVEGSKTTDTSNCANFLECINGKYVSVSCPSGEYWNVNKCVTDNGECQGNPTTTPPPPTCVEGEKEAIASDCAAYKECINGVMVRRQCPAQSYFNTDLEACVIDEDGVCIPKTCDPECCDQPNDWLGPIENNCSAFIHCVYGHKFEQKCPNNLQFNVETGECDFPENVNCEDGSAPPSGPTAGPSGTYCASGGVCVGKRDGTMMSEDKNTCSSSFVVCQCECEVILSCPPGLVFSEKAESCDWPANVDC